MVVVVAVGVVLAGVAVRIIIRNSLYMMQIMRGGEKSNSEDCIIEHKIRYDLNN